MKGAAIYHRERQYLFHSESLTTAGMWTFCEPVLRVADTSDDHEFGLALRTALDGSRTGVPHPDTSNMPKPLMRVAGVKSWTKLAEGAEHAFVQAEGERITLLPMKKLGKSRWVFENPVKQLVLERATLEELGAAIRRLMP